MKTLTVILFYLPQLLLAQDNSIVFHDSLQWNEIVQKSKIERKMIFVDCFASWCVPCKVMEKTVYNQQKVAQFFNEHFISVKVQLDTSKNDDELRKRWYPDAHFIKTAFGITSYPSFLFFSPNGEIVHKSIGARKADDFIFLGMDALDSNKQYYTLIRKYEKGHIDYKKMPYLIKLSKSLGDRKLFVKIGEDYASNYLNNLNDSNFYTKDNLFYITQFISNSNTEAFRKIYKNVRRINNVMNNDGFAQDYITRIISAEEVNPNIYHSNGIPIDTVLPSTWGKISSAIKKKYNDYYADRSVVAAKIAYYYTKEEWQQVSKYMVYYVEKLSSGNDKTNSYFINNYAWEIFQYSNNENELRTAIKWMEKIIKKPNSAGWAIDTYANLLYKIGEVKEAILWEEKVVKENPDDKESQEYLNKMKTGQPTWALR